MQTTSLHFAAVARCLAATARSRGLLSPMFRSPPRLADIDRTIRRGRGKVPTVAVRLSERPLGAVVADMVEGVIVTNDLTGAEATRTRTVLWEAVSQAVALADQQAA